MPRRKALVHRNQNRQATCLETHSKMARLGQMCTPGPSLPGAVPLSTASTVTPPPPLASKLLLTSSKWKEAKLWGPSGRLVSHPGSRRWPSAGHMDRCALAEQTGLVTPSSASVFQGPVPACTPHLYVSHTATQKQPVSAFLREPALSGDYLERSVGLWPAHAVLR